MRRTCVGHLCTEPAFPCLALRPSSAVARRRLTKLPCRWQGCGNRAWSFCKFQIRTLSHRAAQRPPGACSSVRGSGPRSACPGWPSAPQNPQRAPAPGQRSAAPGAWPSPLPCSAHAPHYSPTKPTKPTKPWSQVPKSRPSAFMFFIILYLACRL